MPRPFGMSRVDIIVLDFDGGAMLQQCVDSIVAQTLAPERVLVLDNASKHPAVDRLHAPVEIIRSIRNLGFAGGANMMFERSLSPFVAIVNNDVVLDRDWLSVVLAAMEGDDHLAAVQTVIRRDEKTIDGAGVDIADGTIRQAGHGSPLGTSVPPAWGVSATATLYRREALQKPMFRESFFAWYEDVELCARLRGNGWHTAVLPVAKATHLGSQTAAKLGGRAKYLRTRNRYWVARLHPGVGRIGSLLWEDAKLTLKGRSSLTGAMAGLFGKIS